MNATEANTGVSLDVTTEVDVVGWEIARRWCEAQGAGWAVRDQAGKGGTAPVFSVVDPGGVSYALKINNEEFSSGPKGAVEESRIRQQLALKGHGCPSLVQVFDGGFFDGRLVLLMNRAPGRELEKCLSTVPRERIRHIVDQVAKAVLFLRSKSLCHRDIKSANIFVSDDYEQVTLLDLSVLRDIHDPVGLGTDHGNQLPVVATARYSPPEYLFRLLDPGPDLWHALDVYQLGALLHDLIMRRPLFQAEFNAASANRYRFAWAVATVTPHVQAPDADQDLVFLANRALDKDWRRRSALRIEDFLLEAGETAAIAAEAMLGLGRRIASPQTPMSLTQRRSLLRAAAERIDENIVAHLRAKNVVPRHETKQGAEEGLCVHVSWLSKPATDVDAAQEVELKFSLRVSDGSPSAHLECNVALAASIHGNLRCAELRMPSAAADASGAACLADQAVEAFRGLAKQLAKASSTGGG